MSRSARVAGFAALVGFVAVAARSHDAHASWPPAANSDLRNPANWPSDPGYRDAFGYWSFLPAQSGGTAAYLAADVALGASGMSVDAAWTKTIGRADVTIAIVDSGIAWEAPDLLNKAYLNPLELAGTKKPMNGLTACGGKDDLAGYDCDGDGIFTVHDYATDPRIAPVVAGDKCFSDGNRTNRNGPDRIQGDVNHNCVFDAGDLIELFSDGVDDDTNGYTDDISGWDFFKNDNNPYDDIRNGHGTTEAAESSAEGNNALESLGACPMCRFELLRAGDSALADANDFAKAVVYATDNGAKVVQSALTTLDMTAFARAAIDYAYVHNVTVVANVGEENSRHHAFPATANHTLPVHAIAYDGGDFASSTSFLAFDTCTNYGGQLALSVSGKGCSSEAVGRSAGIAGLVYSMAIAQPAPLDLSAEEVMQLLKGTADDIDVAESRTSNRYYESKTGWDQRFGYGRENAMRALEAIEARLIPPEVDIVSPAWFAPIFADRAGGQIAIQGRIAATRAVTYDYAVAWAPGVEPDDAAFKPVIADVTNVPSSTIIGGDKPIATFDPRQLDTAHTADPDSLHHENDRTITLRIRAIAHYGAIGDQRGEARRTIAVVNEKNGLDADLLTGFPIALTGSIEASPKLADIDGDGVRDIVVAASDGLVHVFTSKSGLPVEVAGFPARTLPIDGLNEQLTTEPTVPGYTAAPAYTSGAIDKAIAREALVSAPAIADVSGDGANEIVFTSLAGTIYVVDAKGESLTGWPKRLPLVPSCLLDPSKPPASGACMDAAHGVARGALASPVIVDMDKDGKPEIVQAAFDGNVYVFHADGSALDGWPVAIHAKGAARTNRIASTPAVTDFNGDGIPDLVLGSNESVGANGGPVFMVDGRGTKTPGGPYFPHWPVTLASLDPTPLVGEGILASPAAADFDGDGRTDALLQGNGASPLVVPADPGMPNGPADLPPNALPLAQQDDGSARRGFDAMSVFGANSNATQPDAMFPLFSHPSIGDLDQDGTPDVVMSGAAQSLLTNLSRTSSTLPFQYLLAMWSGKTGRMFSASPFVVEDSSLLASQAIADITGDDYPEVIAGNGGYFVHAVDACGREADGWPKFTNGWLLSTPAVGDVDGASGHGLEVVAGTREGYLFAWHTKGREGGVVAWESFHHDNANTGDYEKKLTQGSTKRASAPIDCTIAPAQAEGAWDAGGCAIGGILGANEGTQSPSAHLACALATAAGAFAAIFARRRRRSACQGQPR